MRSQYLVLVVAPNGELTNNAALAQITGAHFDHASTVHDLYGYFTSGKRSVDLIVFDIPTLCGQAGTQGFEITNMIQVLARITPQKTPPVMAVLVDQNTDAAQLQQITDTDISGVVPHPQWLTLNDSVTAIQELLMGHTYLPRRLLDQISNVRRASTAKKVSDTIVLTARQNQVLHLICHRGASNKTIARQLKISESTVKLHVSSIFKKYGVRNRTQLALSAVGQELVAVGAKK